MTRTIKISEAIWKYLEENGRFGETADTVLRRGLSLPPEPEPTVVYRPRTVPPRAGHATNRLERRVGNGVLELAFASGESKRFPLPDRTDKQGIRETLKAAHDWARGYDTSLGQLNAIRKSLTDNGYHLTRSGSRSQPTATTSRNEERQEPITHRIEDTLSVLGLMKTRYAPGKDARGLRIEATKRAEELRKLKKNDGVTRETVHAHLMGKDTRHTQSYEEFDQIAQEWLNGSPRALRDWLLLIATQPSDREAITRFFQQEDGRIR